MQLEKIAYGLGRRDRPDGVVRDVGVRLVVVAVGLKLSQRRSGRRRLARFSNVMRPEDYAAFVEHQDDASKRKWNLWAYIDARDGAQAVRLALESDITGCEIFVIANADTVMNRPNTELLAECFPDVEVRRTPGEHQTLLSIDKARRLLGYEPRHSWRDETGHHRGIAR